jgi:hypothetical protein
MLFLLLTFIISKCGVQKIKLQFLNNQYFELSFNTIYTILFVEQINKYPHEVFNTKINNPFIFYDNSYYFTGS